MLEWLAENIGTILITAGLIVIVALIIRSIVRDKKAGISSCGAKCGGCGACAHGRKNATAHRAAAAAPSGMLKT